jgi:tungstate transport system substrate-binding protein
MMLTAAFCVSLTGRDAYATTEARLKLATTTSTDNSGLLDILLPPFEEMFGVRVDVIAVGTGKALALGRNGDVDIVLVHARSAEDEFVEAGYGVNRRDVMYNDFIIIGPGDDPAGIKDSRPKTQDPRLKREGEAPAEPLESPVFAALKSISAKKAPFVSRGDDSGTHKREKILWKEAGIEPTAPSSTGDWYMETGQGMGATLQIADEKRAYTISDRGTYLAYKGKIQMEILVQSDAVRLANPYGIIAVNPAKHPHVNYIYAMALIGWVTSVEGQKIIAEYKRFGESLFYPMAISGLIGK